MPASLTAEVSRDSGQTADMVFVQIETCRREHRMGSAKP